MGFFQVQTISIAASPLHTLKNYLGLHFCPLWPQSRPYNVNRGFSTSPINRKHALVTCMDLRHIDVRHVTLPPKAVAENTNSGNTVFQLDWPECTSSPPRPAGLGSCRGCPGC